MSSPIVGPIAPYSNPPINPQYYSPREKTISAITLGKTTLITTASNHQFSVGSLIRLFIPVAYGAPQLNNRQALVITVPSLTTVTLDLDSSLNVDPFITSPSSTNSIPLIVAIGDYNSGAINSSPTNLQNYPNGSFINIS